MSFFKINISPRYSETDQMGIIHHSNYLIYMEQARLAWLSSLGFSYEKMEKEGILLPVYKIDIVYKKPIKFDDVISVKVRLKALPTARVVFEYEIVNNCDVICATCDLTLVFTDAHTFRPRKPIPEFVEACQRLF
ncbi:MAG: thioesterase family protein [Nonlabens sp.]|uniref:acyl-CoA thioesterase n=1 Tax=Nonlabens sp. TaxID=1888209 RepID=UPI00321C35C6